MCFEQSDSVVVLFMMVVVAVIMMVVVAVIVVAVFIVVGFLRTDTFFLRVTIFVVFGVSLFTSSHALFTSPLPSKAEEVVQFEPWQRAVVTFAAPAVGTTPPFLYTTLELAPTVIMRPGNNKTADECWSVSMRSPSMTTVELFVGVPFILTWPFERKTA